jgi:hypothetical protein
MASDRERRIGQNEILFRAVNEEIRRLDERFGAAAPGTQWFVCECGQVDCTERIEMTPDEYLRVRADPAMFVAVAGHQEPDVEDVVERTERYVVLKKRPGEPAALAERAAPSR